MKNIKVTPSILSADFGHLADEIRKSESAGVDGFHLDIMDGHLVPNISMGPMVAKTVSKLTKLPLDAHLMIDNPDLYIEDFANAGAEIITLHLESYDLNIPDTREIKKIPRIAKEIDFEKLIMDLRFIKSLGKKAGISLNPGTSEKLLEQFFGEIDEILFMSVNPGFSGQKLMPEVLRKIKNTRKKFNKDIRIDGGINDKTAQAAIAAGANILVTASYFYGSKNYKEAAGRIRNG
ncbi:MAG: ribulose-phosphate 3-epimerase [Candidatus Saganbacteria bacterium]|nr:ribulose-phosphate 3-epimerase [Candidatus Saganbacteria bacterium]